MFNVEQVKRYCHKEDIPLIEGYAEAASSDEIYVVHHRNEIQPDGTRHTRKWLKDHHLYWGRPHWELIFMKDVDHRKLHKNDYHESDFWATTRKFGILKMQGTKRTDSRRQEQSMRAKAFWSSNREKMHEALCKRYSVYKNTYGMKREEIAKKLGFTEWKVEQLHKRGVLKCYL